MRDRSVEYPNRYRMTLVPGTTDIYELTPAPGEVYENGTLMSKANLLSANSETDLWGNDGDRTPNDAFSFIGKLLSEHDENIANLAATLEGKIVTGTYTGNGTASRTISLGVTPKAVLVVGLGTSAVTSNTYNSLYAALAVEGQPALGMVGNLVAIVDGGFDVYYAVGTSTIDPRDLTNNQGSRFCYITIT